MKATGILRRIDELGRVVIPKEIRKTMKMREGEELEIYTTGNEVVLKKYSEINSMVEISRFFTEAVFSVTGHSIAIVDNDNVIACAGKTRELVNVAVTNKMHEIINKRKNVVFSDNDIMSISGEIMDYKSQYIVPIMAAGDVYGAIILCCDVMLDKSDEKLINTAVSFFERQINR